MRGGCQLAGNVIVARGHYYMLPVCATPCRGAVREFLSHATDTVKPPPMSFLTSTPTEIDSAVPGCSDKRGSARKYHGVVSTLWSQVTG